MKSFLSALLPRSVYRALATPYHYLWSWFIAVRSGFPAKKLLVIGVTGTKGKSTVAEMLTRIFEDTGKKVVLSSTIHFKIGGEVRANRYKMTLPGHGFIQKLLAEGVRAGCEVAIIEITSEAAVQHRHAFLYLDALVFTNLQKEHLESHGGMEQYFNAKMRIGKALAASSKRPRAIIANADDTYGLRFLELPVEKRIPFRMNDAEKVSSIDTNSFVVGGTLVALPHPGDHNMMNALAAMKTGDAFGISYDASAKSLAALSVIPGRTERIDVGQSFTAVVDYAHTPDSLRALYEAYKGERKICVLGNTGGGRDTWKRPEMGRIAEAYCEEVILTDEDPYDEDPRQIVDAMAAGMVKKPRIIMDRRDAIREALALAQPGDVVLVSGKGTDPYIMRVQGAKEPWSDAAVVREELQKLG